MNGTTTEYAVDGWNPAKAGAMGTSNFDVWATFTSGGSLISRQIQGDGVDQHLAFVTSSAATWYLTDHLGSTRATINNSGAVQDSLVYDAYGNLTSQSNASAEPLYTYTGREVDVETGLQYNRARWYDPSTGRWITQDPMGFDAGDSNLYRYVKNAPTDEVDPSGASGISIGLTVSALALLSGPHEVEGMPLNVALITFQITAGPQELADLYGTADAKGKKSYPINLLTNNRLDLTPIRGKSVTVTANIRVRNPNTTGPVLRAFAEFMSSTPHTTQDGARVNVSTHDEHNFVQAGPGVSSVLTVEMTVRASERGTAGEDHTITLLASTSPNSGVPGSPGPPFVVDKSFTWSLNAKGK